MAIVPPHTHPRHEHPQYAVVPVGAVIAYGGATAPDGWHLCDGTAHGSTALQAVLGSDTTPDLRDKFVLGKGGTQPTSGGAATHTLTSAEMPAHDHGGTLTGGGHQHTYISGNTTNDAYGLVGSAYHQGNVNVGGSAKNTYSADGSHAHGIYSNGGGAAHNNMPPYYALTYIIKT